MSNIPTNGKLLTDAEAERIAGARELKKLAQGPVLVDLLVLLDNAIPALLADRAARIEREAKVRELVSNAETFMSHAAPDSSLKAAECIYDALSLLSHD